MREYEVIAEGLAFPEGPVAMADGSVIVVEIMAGRVTRCWNGRTETVCETGGGPNGAAIGPDGALWVCNNGGVPTGSDVLTLGHAPDPGRIERIDLATGRVERVYDACGGEMLGAPNDLVFDADGNLWFTDFGKFTSTGKNYGGLYCAAPDGGSIIRIDSRTLSYNGVGVSPDMQMVYVSDTLSARVYSYVCKAEPQVPRLVATVPGMTMVDSMAITVSGNVCVATIGKEVGAISTVTSTGEVKSTDFDDPFITNIAFGGEDMRDAWLTFSISGRLVRTRWDEPGLRLVYNA